MHLQNSSQQQYVRSRWYRRALQRAGATEDHVRVVAPNAAGVGVAAIVLGAIVGAALGVIIGAVIDATGMAIGLGAVVGVLTGMAVAAIVAGRQVFSDEVHREGWD